MESQCAHQSKIVHIPNEPSNVTLMWSVIKIKMCPVITYWTHCDHIAGVIVQVLPPLFSQFHNNSHPLSLLGLSMAYHPQTDGQTKRINQEVEQYLHHFVNEWQNNWSSLLPTAEFALNNQVNASTGKSPFELVYGYSPWVGLEPHKDSKVEKAEEFATQMKETWTKAQASLRLAKEDMAQYYNERHKPTPSYDVGNKVWLDASNISTMRPTKKLDVKQLGPFVITDRIGSHNYRLKLPKGLFVHPTFYVFHLHWYSKDLIPEHHQKPPPPIKTKEGPAYEIERLLNVQLWKQRRHMVKEFLVDWKGYGKEEHTWEPEHHISKIAVKAFYKSNPNVICCPSSHPSPQIYLLLPSPHSGTST